MALDDPLCTPCLSVYYVDVLPAIDHSGDDFLLL